MAWPKGKSRREFNESAVVQEPGVPAVGHEAVGGDGGPVHRDLPDVSDGPRPHAHRREAPSPRASDGEETIATGSDPEGEAGPEDVCLTDWENIPLPEAQRCLQRLRDTLEKAAQIVQTRITSEQASECAYCGKTILDHAKAFSRMTNRNPKTGMLVTTDVCTEQCYRGYRAREAGGNVSYATT
jgi:hypothetical protein